MFNKRKYKICDYLMIYDMFQLFIVVKWPIYDAISCNTCYYDTVLLNLYQYHTHQYTLIPNYFTSCDICILLDFR